MNRLSRVFRNCLIRLFRSSASQGSAARQARVVLKVEALEDRVVPSGQGGGTLGVAHSVTTAAATYTLNNTGILTVTPTGGTATEIDSRVAAFNLDSSGALWDLDAGGTLWLLKTTVANGINPTLGWSRQDSNVGSISLSSNGTLADLKINGNLWRWSGGVTGSWNSFVTPLATGITKANVDGASNVYALKDGTLQQFAPNSTTAVDLNTKALGAGTDGQVVSFEVGNNTVAFLLGSAGGGNVGLVDVSYDNGTTFNFLSGDKVAAGTPVNVVISEYGVTADGTVFARTEDGTNVTNSGSVLQLAPGSVNMNAVATPVQVNGANATLVEISPDGAWIALINGASDLSAYTITGGVLGTEDKLDTGKATSWGIANDNRVYEFTAAAPATVPVSGTLTQWTPPATAGISNGMAATSAVVNPNVIKWVLGPNGQVSYLTGLTNSSYFWGNDNGLVQQQDGPGFPSGGAVSDIAVAPNGEQYDLETNGNLWGWTNAGWTLLDGASVGGAAVAAFTVGTNSQLFETEVNGNLWKTTRTNGGWVLEFTHATTNPAQLFTLPDGTVITLINNNIEQITSDTAIAYGAGYQSIVYRDGSPGPGVSSTNPALNPLSVDGISFSFFTASGLFVPTITPTL